VKVHLSHRFAMSEGMLPSSPPIHLGELRVPDTSATVSCSAVVSKRFFHFFHFFTILCCSALHAGFSKNSCP
jgi:hypothetical protein